MAVFRASPTTGAAVSLVVQMAVGCGLFTALTLIAAGVHLVLTACHTVCFPPMVATGMEALEFFLWSADVICFGLFVITEVWLFVREMVDVMKGAPDGD